MTEKMESLCSAIVSKLNQLGVCVYEFKVKLIVKAGDLNTYVLDSIEYNNMEDDGGGARGLFCGLHTSTLFGAVMSVEAFDEGVLQQICDLIPVKFVALVTAHTKDERGSFIVSATEVDANCVIENWAAENYPLLDWQPDDEDQVVSYSHDDDGGYMLATLMH